MPEIKYERQSRIPAWDQTRLSQATIAIVGAGALGNHVCLGLIGLGVGTLKIYDYDRIEPHNLNRQSLFCEADVGQNKAEALASRLKERNSTIFIVGIDQKIEEDTVDTVLGNVDVIVDCVDRIYVRRILNRFALMENIPLIHGGISWLGGQAGILTRTTPCVNCIYPPEVQQTELEEETSCTRKPEASVVYISQMIGGLMVNLIRRVLLPLPDDPKLPPGLYKIDTRFHPFFYFEPTTRLTNCECVDILQQIDPSILDQERDEKLAADSASHQELLSFLHSPPSCSDSPPSPPSSSPSPSSTSPPSSPPSSSSSSSYTPPSK